MELAIPNVYPIEFADETKTHMLTDVAWGAHVGCDDQPKGRIGLYTLLKLLAHQDGHDAFGYPIGDPETNSVLEALREADPKQKHWHLQVNRHGLHTIWRRKEWNESMTKQQADAVKKEVMILNESEYQQAKATVMELLLMITDGNKPLAEKLFLPLANNHAKLIEKAAGLRKAKEAKGLV